VPSDYAGFQEIDLLLDVDELPSGKPPTEVTAYACSPTGIGCDDRITNEPVRNGQATLRIGATDSTGFTGYVYLEQSSADAGVDGGTGVSALLPSYLLSTLPFVDDHVKYVGMPTRAMMDSWLSAAGAAFDPGVRTCTSRSGTAMGRRLRA
jgi:hypothetical protein